MGTNELSGMYDELVERGEGGDNLASIQIQGEVVIFLVALWQGNQDKLWLGRPLGLSTDLTFLTSHLQHSRDINLLE